MRSKFVLSTVLMLVAAIGSAQVVPQRRYLEPQIAVQDSAPDNPFAKVKWFRTVTNGGLSYLYYSGSRWLPAHESVIPGEMAVVGYTWGGDVDSYQLATTYTRFPVYLSQGDRVLLITIPVLVPEVSFSDLTFTFTDSDGVSLAAVTPTLRDAYVPTAAGTYHVVELSLSYTESEATATRYVEIETATVDAYAIAIYDLPEGPDVDYEFETSADEVTWTPDTQGMPAYTVSTLPSYLRGSLAGATMFDISLEQGVLGKVALDRSSSGLEFTVTDQGSESLPVMTVSELGSAPHFSLDQGGDLKANTLGFTVSTWGSMFVSATSMTLEGTNDPAFLKVVDNSGGSTGIFARAFDLTTEQELYFTFQLPRDWEEGSDINAYAHWAPADGTAGTVIWGLECEWVEVAAAFAGSDLTASEAIASPEVALQYTRSAIGTLSGAGKTVSSVVTCRVYREAGTDTYAANAFLFGVELTYQVDSVGSTAELSKP